MSKELQLPEGRLLRAVALVPQVRQMDGGSKKVEGYAAKWNEPWDKRMTDFWGFVEMFAPGAFTDSIRSNMGNAYASYQHKYEYTIGRYPRTLELIEDETGLQYRIDPPAWASWIVETIERGDVSQSSFIFDYQNYEWQERGENEPPILLVKSAILYEVSPVSSPAYPSSEATARSMEKVLKTMPKRLVEQRRTAELERSKQLRELQIFNLGGLS